MHSSTAQKYPNATNLLVNLSAIMEHRLLPAVSAFAGLPYQHQYVQSNSLCSAAARPLFRPLSKLANLLQVVMKFIQYNNSIIEPYKESRVVAAPLREKFGLDNQALTTRDFLSVLSRIFPFSKTAQLHPREKEKLWDTRSHYYSLCRVEDQATLTDLDYIKALLEDCWNSLYQNVPQSKQKMRELIASAKQQGKKIYFYSNTNVLNLFFILHLLLEEGLITPQEFMTTLSALDSRETSQVPLQVTANIFLVISCKYACFKTDGLLRLLWENTLQSDFKNTVLLTQYEKDVIASKQIAQANGATLQYELIKQGTSYSQKISTLLSDLYRYFGQQDTTLLILYFALLMYAVMKLFWQ